MDGLGLAAVSSHPSAAGPDALPLSRLGVCGTCAVGGVCRPPQAAMPVTEGIALTLREARMVKLLESSIKWQAWRGKMVKVSVEKLKAGADGVETEQPRSVEEVVERWRRSGKLDSGWCKCCEERLSRC